MTQHAHAIKLLEHERDWRINAAQRLIDSKGVFGLESAEELKQVAQELNAAIEQLEDSA